jgi:copper chaperone CopZ
MITLWREHAKGGVYETAHLFLGGCPLQRVRLRIVGVHCSTCIIPVRRALEKAEGVKSVGANYMTDLILVGYDEKVTNEAEIVALIKKVGYEAITLAAPYF